jgi:tRNA-splicing ligase RtcB (3'-phosphate/5'-hydroxy nucleic acid ligase)
MNTTQLRKLGVPDLCLTAAIQAIQTAISSGACKGKDVKTLLRQIVAAPAEYVHDPQFGAFAGQLVKLSQSVPREPIPYQTWGTDIEAGCHAQMRQACALPMAVGAALMPDAHLGYGLPIGGVLALDNAVVPYAVGVDIACRMKLSVLDLPVSTFDERPQLLETAIQKCTRFGIGAEHERPQDHAVLDEDWTITRITREHKDKARRQLGTSGSGNHFVEFGVLSVPTDEADLGLPAGDYVALLSHSGSRGVGAAVCDVYSRVARSKLPPEFAEIGRLAWLSLDDEAGQEYWAAMNLMGDYAAANHAVIHRLVSQFLGSQIVAGVENHHNFAWKEQHGGKEVIVHRKGATPAGKGVLGVIPGSMSAPAFVVRGKGNPASLDSASHGAGRLMSRTAARSQFRFNAVQKELAQQGIRVLSAGSDEVPSVYKDIHAVMGAQIDLVEELARFQPRIVKMSDDPRSED